jgi:hypothetical protein
MCKEMHEMLVKNADNDRALLALGWLIFMICGGIFVLLSFIIEMPYQSWLDEHLPVWLGIIITLIFAICFVILAIPGRTLLLNYFVSTIFLLSVFFLKASLRKDSSIILTIFAASIVIFISLRIYHKYK